MVFDTIVVTKLHIAGPVGGNPWRKTLSAKYGGLIILQTSEVGMLQVRD